MPVYILVLLAIGVLVLLPKRREGSGWVRIALVVMSVLLLIGAVQRLFFTPNMGALRIASFESYQGVSGAYAGRYIAETYPGETVAVVVQSISQDGFKLGSVDKAVLNGLRDEIRKAGGSVQTVTTRQEMLTEEMMEQMLGDLRLDVVEFEIEHIPEQAIGARVVVSLVGLPGPQLVESLSGTNERPALIVFHHPYPPNVAGAVRSGRVEALVCLRPGADPDMTFDRRAPMDELFDRRFYWVTAANVGVLNSVQ